MYNLVIEQKQQQQKHLISKRIKYKENVQIISIKMHFDFLK